MERKDLVLRGVAECVTEDELSKLLSSNETPKAYVGFEPSGLLHAGSLVPMLKTRELVEAGFEVTILLADWHGYINDKLGADWDNLRAGVDYQRQMFSAFSPGVNFQTASELVRQDGYWEMVLRVSKTSSLKRMRRALNECAVTGIPTTIDFHLYLLNRDEFLRGDVHTKFVEQEMLG